MNEIARRSDPSSSHLAARYLERSGQQRRLIPIAVSLVERYPGRTYSELHQIQDEEARRVGISPPFGSRESLQKRLNDARARKAITDDEKPMLLTRCAASVKHLCYGAGPFRPSAHQYRPTCAVGDWMARSRRHSDIWRTLGTGGPERGGQ